MRASVHKPFLHLKKRFQFLTVSRSGVSLPKHSFVLQFFTHPTKDLAKDLEASEDSPLVRFGFTASKKAGGAVQRNRCKRRLRALVQKHLNAINDSLSKPTDMVFIARTRTATLPFAALEQSLQEALGAIRHHEKAKKI